MQAPEDRFDLEQVEFSAVAEAFKADQEGAHNDQHKVENERGFHDAPFDDDPILRPCRRRGKYRQACHERAYSFESQRKSTVFNPPAATLTWRFLVTPA